jgi:alkane 1-monooxygenase
MPLGQHGGLQTDHGIALDSAWRDRKRYLWLWGLIIPTLVASSWFAVHATGLGIFWWAGPILMFTIIPVLDYVVGSDAENPPDSALAWLENDPFYRWATYLYLPSQYLSVAFAAWLWTDNGGLKMDYVDKFGLMVTVGGIGGIAINTAHEWGHKRARAERWLSKVALAQTCYGHFFVEHNRGHHVRVATADDPASSRMGESLYFFLPRSVMGSLRSAWNIESRRFASKGKSRWTFKNDVLNAWLMSVALFTSLVLWFGVAVLPWLIGQAIIGFCLLETVNYLEHYGLRRQRRPDGRYESVRPSHAWNGNTVIANILLFHLQRHSDHHANPLRRYQALCHADEAPQLPAGYATMVLLALFPPLWRRVMDRRVLDHYRGDIRLAALSPRHEKRLLQQYRAKVLIGSAGATPATACSSAA